MRVCIGKVVVRRHFGMCVVLYVWMCHVKGERIREEERAGNKVECIEVVVGPYGRAESE